MPLALFGGSRLACQNGQSGNVSWLKTLSVFASAEAHPTRESTVPKKREEGNTTSMKPRITIITLGVDDLDKSLTFYRDGLGLPTQGIIGKEFEHGAVVFFDLQNGVKLALWPRESIAHDTTIPVQAPGATDCTLVQYDSTQEEVDRGVP